MNILSVFRGLHFSKRGFTAIELVLAIGIVAVLSTLGTSNYVGYKNEETLNSTALRIAADLRGTIQRSQAQENGSQWGVHFQNGVGASDLYTIWYGTDYASALASGHTLTSYYLPQTISFLDPAESSQSEKDVSFAKTTGVPSVPSFSVIIRNATQIRKIKVNELGLVLIYDVIPPPSIDQIDGANPQPRVGGQSITIRGQNFLNGATVAVSNFPATNVLWVSEQELTALAPSQSSIGAYDVVVTNPDNQVSAACLGCMNYLDPPTVTTLDPVSGDVAQTSALLRSTVNPNGGSTTAWFRLYSSDPGSCSNSQTRVPGTGDIIGSGIVDLSYNVNTSGTLSLTPLTPYWYCAFASNAAGTSSDVVKTFTTLPPLPTVTTSSPILSEIYSTIATLRGQINPNSTASSTVWFRHRTTTTSTCTDSDSWGVRVNVPGTFSGTTLQNFSVTTTTGLSANTQYWFCAFGNNWNPTAASGGVQTFTTLPNLSISIITPSQAVRDLGTVTISSITGTNFRSTSTVRLILSPNSPIPCTVPYVNSTLLQNGTCSVTPTTAIGTWNIEVSNPSPNPQTATKAFTVYGIPTYVSAGISNLTQTSVTFNGSFNPNGATTTGWFRYSSTYPGSCSSTFSGTNTSTYNLGAGTVPFNYSRPQVSPLAPNTLYWYCAIASNSGGTRHGALFSFKTLATPPSVSTLSYSIMGSTVTFNGQANPNGTATNGWFRYDTTNPGAICVNDTFGTRAPSSGGDSLGFGTSLVDYDENPPVLVPGTTYYFCAIAENLGGKAYGNVLFFTMPITWSYRVPVTITNTNTSVLTNYQIAIFADTASLITAGKMNSNCNDLRVRDSNGTTEISFWVEINAGVNSCNTGATKIRAKIPSIPASTTKTVYLYYGAPTAPSASDGVATYIFFDDFSSSTTLPTSGCSSKWCVSPGTPPDTRDIVSTGSKYLRIRDDGQNGLKTARPAMSFPKPFIVELDFEPRYSSGDYKYGMAISTAASAIGQYVFQGSSHVGTSSDWSLMRAGAGVDAPLSGSSGYTEEYTCNCGAYMKFSEWNKFTAGVYPSGSAVFDVVNGAGPSLVWNFNGQTSGPFYIHLGGYYNNNPWATGSTPTSETWYDNVRVRQYVSPWPTAALGSEEILP